MEHFARVTSGHLSSSRAQFMDLDGVGIADLVDLTGGSAVRSSLAREM